MPTDSPKQARTRIRLRLTRRRSALMSSSTDCTPPSISGPTDHSTQSSSRPEPTQIAHALVCELRAKHAVDDVVFLADSATPLQTVCRRHGLKSRYEKHGDHNSIEYVFCKVKYRTFSFGSLFSRADAETSKEFSRSFTSYGVGFPEDHAWPTVDVFVGFPP